MRHAIKTGLVALGIGYASAIGLVPATGSINWRMEFVVFSQATLTALGITAYVGKGKQ